MIYEEHIEVIRSRAKEYIRLRGELMRLMIIEAASKYFSNVIAYSIFIVLSVLMLIFGSVAAGFYLNDILESRYSGFLIVAAFYGLVILILALLRKKIFGGLVRDKIIQEISTSITKIEEV